MPVSPHYRVVFGCYALWLVATVLFTTHELELIPFLPSTKPGVVTGATMVLILGVVRLFRRGWQPLVDGDTV